MNQRRPDEEYDYERRRFRIGAFIAFVFCALGAYLIYRVHIDDVVPFEPTRSTNHITDDGQNPKSTYVFLVDLNASNASELAALPRIGPALAQRIVDFREERGGFRSVEELLEVKGIGEKTFAKIKDNCWVEPQEDESNDEMQDASDDELSKEEGGAVDEKVNSKSKALKKKRKNKAKKQTSSKPKPYQSDVDLDDETP